MVTRQSGNRRRSASAEASATETLSQSQRKATQRRKTIGNTGQDAGPSSTPTSSLSRAAPNTSRRSMPSRLPDGLGERPLTPKRTPTTEQLQLNTQSSPARTPRGSLLATAAKRFEELRDYSINLMEFYQTYCSHITQAGGALQENAAEELDYLWGLVESHRKRQTYPRRNNTNHFLDLDAVIRENQLENEPDLISEMRNHIHIINRAIFAHYILQCPLLPLTNNEWTVRRIDTLLSSGAYAIWPIAKMTELEACREGFFKYIVPRRLKSPMTVDDLYLYLDLCTQVAIYQIDEDSTDHIATRKRIKIQRALKLVTSNVHLLEALKASNSPSQATTSINDLVQKYNSISSERKDRMEALKFDTFKLHREFSFSDTMTSLFNYISTLNLRELPLMDYKDNLVIPRHDQHIFSLTLRSDMQMRASEVATSIQDREANLFDQDGQDAPMNSNRDEDEEEELPPANQASSVAKGKGKGRLRFTSNGGLRMVEGSVDDDRSNIIRGRGVASSERATHMDDEGTSNPFLEDQVEQAKRSKTKGRPKGSKRKSSKLSSRTTRTNYAAGNDEDEEDEEDEEGPAVKAEAKSPARPRRSARRTATTAEDVDPVTRGEEDEGDEEYLPRASASKAKGKGKAKEKEKERPANQASMGEPDDFEVNEEEIERERVERETRRKKNVKRKSQDDSREDENRPSGSRRQDRLASETSQSHDTESPRKVPRSFAYATGGNREGRKRWTDDETACLLDDLEELYPLYLERGGFQMWSEIVQRHGPNGTISTRLRDRNNVQLKDKARNEYASRYRKQGEAPDWLEKWG